MVERCCKLGCCAAGHAVSVFSIEGLALIARFTLR
jgi:hypothetical protein